MVYPKNYTVTLSESRDIEAILESSSTLSSLSNTCAWSEVDGNHERAERGYHEHDRIEEEVEEEEEYDDVREASFDDRYHSPAAKKKNRSNKKRNGGRSNNPDETELMRSYQSPKRKDKRSRFSPRKHRNRMKSIETRDSIDDEYTRTKFTRDGSAMHVAIGVREGNDGDNGGYDDIELLDDRTLLEEIPEKESNSCFHHPKKKLSAIFTFTTLGVLIYLTLRFLSQRDTNTVAATPDLIAAVPETISDWEKISPNLEGPGLNAAFLGGAHLMSVSMSQSGKRVAVGYPGYLQGVAQVYEENTLGAWVKLGDDIQDAPGENERNAFGSAITLSPDGNFLAVGNKWSKGLGERRGSISVFRFSQGNWTHVGNSIYGTSNYDQSGTSISLSASADRIAIGTPHRDANGIYDAGTVEVFERSDINTTSTWTLLGSSLDGDAKGELFGSSVSLSSDGKRIAIGAPRSNENGKYSGMVKLLEEKDGEWIQIGKSIAGDSENEELGTSVSLSADGQRLSISSLNSIDDTSDESRSSVKVYELENDTFTQLGSQIQGQVTSLSEDGITLAIGSPQNNENGSGIVRIFHFESNDWAQVGNDIDDYSRNSKAGFALKLSGDGTRVAVAAPGVSSAGANSGLVQVFDVIEKN